MRRWVPRPIDLAAAAALTVATQVELWLMSPEGVPLGLVGPSFVVGTLAFAWHRVAPFAALTIGLTTLAVVPGLLGVDPALAFGWFVTTFALLASAGYHARRPVLALAVALVLLAVSIVLPKGPAFADVLYAWILAGGFWLAGRALSLRTVRAELSEQRAARAEEQAQWRAASAVADERLRIAREMHDVISHSVSVMTLHVSGVRRLLRPDQVEERAALETVERTGRESLAEMHRMLGVLRGPDEDGGAPSQGLARLPDLLRSARAAGLDAVLTVDGDDGDLPAGVDLAAYRIVQEAVTNVLRHARARQLTCSVHHRPTALEIGVVDDGTGAPARREGHGLVGMRERAAAYGGTVEAGPRPEGGWAVHARLPVPPVERPAPVRVAEEAP
ncbi:sensor histidine kinase [Blastococcus sp. CT_GayMR20]|uniref:sensor histidine kinase n=1 Tax=Blastococcus sp. CT_GayMR20 TaxID=2559609 RepID=UPI0010745D20|nr:sensor histidine kinase [Blastococcus sp. CT_GayMR20]TFV87685.1 sensor histidine kinase [Blastococcus sp. CT_GayMR20]